MMGSAAFRAVLLKIWWQGFHCQLINRSKGSMRMPVKNDITWHGSERKTIYSEKCIDIALIASMSIDKQKY